MSQVRLGVVFPHHNHPAVSVHVAHAVGALRAGLGHHLSLNLSNLQTEHGEEMAAASLESGSYWSLVPVGAGRRPLKVYCREKYLPLIRGEEELVAGADHHGRAEGLVKASRGLVGQSQVRVGQSQVRVGRNGMASVSEEVR